MSDSEVVRQCWEGVEPEYLTTLTPLQVRAHDLIGLVCLNGGGQPPHMTVDLPGVFEQIKAQPQVPVTVTSTFDCNGGPYQFPREDNAYQRRMDMHVLERLLLVPGDTRRAWELFRRMKANLPTLDGICVFEEPTEKWPNWPQEALEAYQRGLQELPYPQDREQMAEQKRISVAEIEQMDQIFLRPHHFMCIMCFAGGGGNAPLEVDNLYEVLMKMKQNPDIKVTLIEGACMVCPPCHGWEPRSGTCLAGCGLRDHRKDLDTLQLLDLLPGDTLTARELFQRFTERIPSATLICQYAEHTIPEWQACGSCFTGKFQEGLAKGL